MRFDTPREAAGWGARQIPLAPGGGIVQAVPAGEPYPTFPVGGNRLWDRMKWARDAPVADPTDHRGVALKAVLWLTSLYANDDGIAFPAAKTLAAKGCMNEKTVRGALNRLVEKGWLTRDNRAGKTPFYRPKAPRNEHCPGCRYEQPRGQEFCLAGCGGKPPQLEIPWSAGDEGVRG